MNATEYAAARHICPCMHSVQGFGDRFNGVEIGAESLLHLS